MSGRAGRSSCRCSAKLPLQDFRAHLPTADPLFPIHRLTARNLDLTAPARAALTGTTFRPPHQHLERPRRGGAFGFFSRSSSARSRGWRSAAGAAAARAADAAASVAVRGRACAYAGARGCVSLERGLAMGCLCVLCVQHCVSRDRFEIVRVTHPGFARFPGNCSQARKCKDSRRRALPALAAP